MKLLAMTDEQIIREITSMTDNMMEGSTEIDHAKHTRDFTDRMKSLVTPDWLEAVCTDYQNKWGFFGERDFVALFRRRESVAVVWRQYCSKTSDEYVLEVVFVELNNRVMIDHAMVY
jgi:hypothetical protein